jgi:signal transduction histidine kinase
MTSRAVPSSLVAGHAPASVEAGAVRWYRSFYFRIGFSFVLFSVCLLVLQTVLFNALRTRSPLGDRAPNTVVAIVAADLGAVLGQDPSSDLDAHLKREYGQSQPIYVVMRNGRVASNRSTPLAGDMQRYVETLLVGGAHDRHDQPPVPVPFVTAPVVAGGALHGIVVLPPAPPPNPLVRDVERLASLPGTLLLVVLTVVAAAFMFEPARRRLKSLQAATQRLGAGDLTARATAAGGDEIAEVASTFNRMAEELVRREEALRASDRLRRQMLADVSHELKTPLTAMRGYVETLKNEDITLDRDTRARYFATLEHETVRLDRIVRDLLDLARLENGVADLDRRVFATGRVFEHVVRRHQPEVERRQVTVRLDVAAAADQMVADPNRLEQVIENLFANALRHTPDGGRIDLAAWMDGGAVMLAVTDSGAGIPAEHVPHVFNRFYKVDSARANASVGSGLGLSIAKAIVDRHGGTIAVTSRPGQTAFTIALPQHRDDRAA